jgi:DNA-binding transcriptional LysR family regulator
MSPVSPKPCNRIPAGPSPPTRLTGPLRISAPVSFGILHLGQALFGFLAKDPGIELILELDDRFVDILGEGYDAIVRRGPVKPIKLARRHGGCTHPLYRAPSGRRFATQNGGLSLLFLARVRAMLARPYLVAVGGRRQRGVQHSTATRAFRAVV